jgi:hypothetical protein
LQNGFKASNISGGAGVALAALVNPSDIDQ